MKKLLYIDIETTGLDPKTHGIIQLSGFMVIDGERSNDFNFTMKPFKGDLVNADALKANSTTLEHIQAYREPETVYREFINIIARQCDKFNKKDKFFFVAYNSPFDSEFMRQWFLKNGDSYFGSWFWSPILCIMNLAGWKLMNKREELENFKLGTVAEYLGIELDKNQLHDGMYDINLAYQVEQKLLGL